MLRPTLFYTRARVIACKDQRIGRYWCWRTHYSNLIQIENGTFYRDHPGSTPGARNPAFFPDLSFSLPAAGGHDSPKPRIDYHWAVISSTHTSTFLDVLRGGLICYPPNSRTYPYLSSDELRAKDPRLAVPSRAIQYVGFNAKTSGSGLGGGGVKGAYLSARYESRREGDDWTVEAYLRGDTSFNASTELKEQVDEQLLKRVVQDLRMERLMTLPVSNLSNGQTRRSRIAKALLSEPELLLLDEPFMGLDPPTLVTLSPILKELAYRSSPLLILGLRPQDPIPDWITHLIVLGANGHVVTQGIKSEVLLRLSRWSQIHSRVDGLEPMPSDVKQWLMTMQKLHGEPLSNVGDSLASAGIRPYRIHDILGPNQNREGQYFESYINLRGKLSAERQILFNEAESKAPEDRSMEDWFILLASLPEDLEKEQYLTNTPKDEAKILSEDQSGDSSASIISSEHGEPLIELQSVILRYGPKTVLGHPPPQPGYSEPGLNLTISQNSRLALLGPNGSGKTTLLSLLTSDHPQSYSLPIKFFGRSRLPAPGKPGLSLWEIQSRIGHSSPEVHAFFPKRLTARRVLESAWAETFASRPVLTNADSERVDRVLRWFEPEIRRNFSGEDTAAGSSSMRADENYVYPPPARSRDVSWASDAESHAFGVLPFSTQRLLLLLRAIVRSPDIVILDEAFSGLSATTRDRAMCFLEYGETMFVGRTSSANSVVGRISNQEVAARDPADDVFRGLTNKQALIVVSHIREEIPECVNEWIRLPSEEEAVEAGKGVSMGLVSETKEGIRDSEVWNEVWGL